MKKLVGTALISMMVLSVGTAAFAADTTNEESSNDVNGKTIRCMQHFNKEDMQAQMEEMKEKAEEAGMTLEEYMQSIKPAASEMKKPQMGAKEFNKEDLQGEMPNFGEMKKPGMGDKEFNKEDMQTKMDEMKAEMEAKAEEAGMTLEEYMQSIKSNASEMKKPEMGAKEFDKEDLQAKMDEMKAEMEAKAEEAGMTLEEYIKSIKPNGGIKMPEISLSK